MTKGQVARRSLLLAAVGVPVLAGCRVRLEDDAPHVPFVPTREPIADEAYLVGLLAELHRLAEAAAAVQPARPALVTAHTTQADVVESLLERAGVPSATISPTSTATASTSAAQARPTPAALATLEAAALAPAAIRQLAALTTPHAGQVRSIAVHRAAAAQGLGTPPRWPALPTATVSSSPSATAGGASASATPTTSASATASDEAVTRAGVALLAAFRAATYALELAAARSGTHDQTAAASDPKKTQRALLLADAQWAAGRSRTLVTWLGDAVPAPPLGYALPFAVSTPAEAKKLAAHTFSKLELAIGATLQDAGGAACAVALQSLTETLTRGARWGLALRPFPGMAPPATATTTPAAPAPTA